MDDRRIFNTRLFFDKNSRAGFLCLGSFPDPCFGIRGHVYGPALSDEEQILRHIRMLENFGLNVDGY
jgi:hypothetical protein